MQSTLQYKPIPRSKLRLWLGKAYYRGKRRVKWWKMRHQFASRQQPESLLYVHASHQTPLYRKLQNVDMSIQAQKVHNLNLAMKSLHGLILAPGEVMSYWRRIGKPTHRKGYKEGMILFYGTMQLGVGGGLCQLSNLIYWITLHTPLQVMERYRHSYDVFPDASRTQPFGSGATCAYNYLDLMIVNPTNETFQLLLTIDDKELRGEWRSTYKPLYQYKIVERNHRISLEAWGKYMRHNELYQQVYTLEGGLINEIKVAENHALMMYEPMLKQGV
ncbi:VanW family protein [Paenibacillus sp. 1001270B_150601_E10]|uniref:VanW family protein n=1 Tax=Paenibacillus sp. 1001270B_150601_E10 TaxID=2787079 RepID=UPI00189D42EB|nr:VanW family protein [Paenibacillus sp. 1001270B_150601_E10]